MQTKPIPHMPGYSATSDGRIKGPRKWLSLFPDKRGYLRFNIYLNGRTTQHGVHVAVCSAFHGVRPSGFHAAHLNGDCSDNRATNLRWVSPKENESHKVEHGTKLIGSARPQSKLDEDDVREIRKRLQMGERGRALATEYGVTETAISYIRTGKTWGYVQ